jgi:hypothetical protein
LPVGLWIWTSFTVELYKESISLAALVHCVSVHPCLCYFSLAPWFAPLATDFTGHQQHLTTWTACTPPPWRLLLTHQLLSNCCRHADIADLRQPHRALTCLLQHRIYETNSISFTKYNSTFAIEHKLLDTQNDAD